jgi:hypothetical protein
VELCRSAFSAEAAEPATLGMGSMDVFLAEKIMELNFRELPASHV